MLPSTASLLHCTAGPPTPPTPLPSGLPRRRCLTLSTSTSCGRRGVTTLTCWQDVVDWLDGNVTTRAVAPQALHARQASGTSQARVERMFKQICVCVCVRVRVRVCVERCWQPNWSRCCTSPVFGCVGASAELSGPALTALTACVVQVLAQQDRELELVAAANATLVVSPDEAAVLELVRQGEFWCPRSTLLTSPCPPPHIMVAPLLVGVGVKGKINQAIPPRSAWLGRIIEDCFCPTDSPCCSEGVLYQVVSVNVGHPSPVGMLIVWIWPLQSRHGDNCKINLLTCIRYVYAVRVESCTILVAVFSVFSHCCVAHCTFLVTSNSRRQQKNILVTSNYSTIPILPMICQQAISRTCIEAKEAMIIIVTG